MIRYNVHRLCVDFSWNGLEVYATGELLTSDDFSDEDAFIENLDISVYDPGEERIVTNMLQPDLYKQLEDLAIKGLFEEYEADMEFDLND